jgi:ribose/xylose/arabinose/galactoside ABC-type transport system permease subunit
MQHKAPGTLPWPITTLAAVLTAGGGVIVVLWKNLPLEKLPPDAPQPYYQTILLRASPAIAIITVLVTVIAWLLERGLRRRRRAA